MTELAQHRDDHFPALFLFGERFPASVRRTADCIVEVDEGCLEIAHADWRLRKMRITVHSAVHSVAPRLNIAITSAGKPNPCSNHGISSFVSQLFVPQVQTRVTRQEKESCWRQTRVTSREKRVAGSRRASRPGKRELLAADARHVPGKESCWQQTRVSRAGENTCCRLTRVSSQIPLLDRNLLNVPLRARSLVNNIVGLGVYRVDEAAGLAAAQAGL